MTILRIVLLFPLSPVSRGLTRRKDIHLLDAAYVPNRSNLSVELEYIGFMLGVPPESVNFNNKTGEHFRVGEQRTILAQKSPRQERIVHHESNTGPRPPTNRHAGGG